jgi:ubiquinone/menaquinone biosynthesis C-methylase UbiE
MSLLPDRAALTALAYQLGPSRYYQPAYRFIAADVGTERGSFLDVGTGTGWLAIHVASGRREVDAVGIDTSAPMLHYADSNKGDRLNVTFRKMDATNIVYPARTFESAAAVQSAHHWADPAGVFAEVHRVLVDGGRFYVYEADPEAEVPADWIARKGRLPPDAFLRRQWARFGMDTARWSNLRRFAEASPFGPDIDDERHGFYRRLVCTK